MLTPHQVGETGPESGPRSGDDPDEGPAAGPGVGSAELIIAVASPAEARAVRSGLRSLTNGDRARTAVLVVGIGKAPAAARTAATLARHGPAVVLNAGIAGVLPVRGKISPQINDAVLGSASIFADEGLRHPDGFQGCDELGFPPVPPDLSCEPVPASPQGDGRRGAGLAVVPDARVLDPLATLADHTGPIATVSTCSGTDAAALELAQRTGAIAEAMEGAAVGLAARLVGEPRPGEPERPAHRPAFAELRVISNTTGDRDRQRWDLEGALRRLAAVTAEAAARLLQTPDLTPDPPEAPGPAGPRGGRDA